jgi:hypothetical protein
MLENETSSYLCNYFRIDGDASSTVAQRDEWRHTLGKVSEKLCFIQTYTLCNPHKRRSDEHARGPRRAGSSSPSGHTTDVVSRGRRPAKDRIFI